MPESKLQRRIIDDLRDNHHCYVLKNTIGNKPGHPDLTVFTNKATVFLIEVKDEGKKPEPLQEYQHKELRHRGFQVYVIDSWEQYQKLVRL